MEEFSVAKTLLIGFLTIAAAVASAASSYNVSLPQNETIDGKPLKAGTYRIQVKDNMAILRGDNNKATEVPVHKETSPAKLKNTMVRLAQDGSVREIDLGGTTTILRFDAGESSTLGAQ
jgi:hypothetical protein